MARAMIVLVLIALLLPACEDDSTSGGPVELVTIAGVVRNVDDASTAVGVRVRQWGTTYADDVATGTDGAFELKVPRGTKLTLYTDDFNSTTDVWFPLINVDIVPIVANDDVLDLPIHACPRLPPGDTGSLPIWDRYLLSCDDTENGDLFEPTSSNEAGGVVAILTPNACDFAGYDSLTCDLGVPEAPMGYMSTILGWTNQGTPYSTTCNVFEPGSVTQTSVIGWAQSFLDETSSHSRLTLTVTDNSTRGLVFPSAEVPVAKGVISLLLVGVIDGQVVNFPTLFHYCFP